MGEKPMRSDECTLTQARRLLEITEESGCDSESLQQLFGSGLLTDLLKAAGYGLLCDVERSGFQKALTLDRLTTGWAQVVAVPLTRIVTKDAPLDVVITREIQSRRLNLTTATFCRFRNDFFQSAGENCEDIGRTTFRFADVRRPISPKELEGMVSTLSLANVWQLLSFQANKEPGAMLLDSRPNVFLVPSVTGQVKLLNLFVADSDSRFTGWILAYCDARQASDVVVGSRVFG